MSHDKPLRGSQPGPRKGVIVRRLIWTWIQTLLGAAFIGGLVVCTLLYFGVSFSWGLAFLSLWLIIPIGGWYFSANLVKRLTACRPPNPADPNHARLLAVVDRLLPKTGLKVRPPVYISPIKLPNAFATGRTPDQAFIAATEGLFQVGLTDDELEAVLAHELAHVRNYDVAVNSMLAVLGSLFSILLASGLPRLFNPALIGSGAPLLDKLSGKVRDQKQKFFLPVGGFLGFVVMLLIFYLVSMFTKLISLFVARTRESAADAQAVYWTGNPCALSTALQKLTLYMKRHGADLRQGIITRGLTPLLFVNSLEDVDLLNSEPQGGALRRWWRGLGENHPPVQQRIAMLDKMNGGSCPRVR